MDRRRPRGLDRGATSPYCELDELRRLVGEPERAVLVTTKEGEFARLILDDWRVPLADIQGKEAGTHKCDNLRALIAAYTTTHGRRPRVWFVEDRFETLAHVTTHPDLEDVGLFLAAWGYNTAGTRAEARASRRVQSARAGPVQPGAGRLVLNPAPPPQSTPHRIVIRSSQALTCPP